jgi:ferric-dicitrate binding protein FerR (iron transport regulator)
MYFADRISDAERAEIIGLLETDSEFAECFREMEKAYVLSCIPAFEKTKDSNFKLIERRIRVRRNTAYFWKPFAIAASIAAVLLLGAALYADYKFHSAESLMCQSDTMTVTAKKGTGTETLLPDGTRVCLNAESALTFCRHFGRGGRDVTLVGEGYFEVASDPGSPFRVHSGNACVTVKGTTFNVRNYADEPEITVSLLEGSVVLNSGAEEAALEPGYCAVVSRENDAIQTKPADPYASDWIKGMIVFTDKSIPEILRDVERNYGVRFIYDRNLFGQERFTGRISYRLSIDEILSYIDVDNKYRWRRNEDTIEIFRK